MLQRFHLLIINFGKGKTMYENSLDSIKKAQNGDKQELWKLMRENNRTNMEHCKKI